MVKVLSKQYHDDNHTHSKLLTKLNVFEVETTTSIIQNCHNMK
jgi:hypothetical protein